MSTTKLTPRVIAVVCSAFVLGVFAAVVVPTLVRRMLPSQPQPANMLALAYGPGKYGDSLYGACIFTAPTPTGVNVHARIWIDGPDYYHDCGVIATAKSQADARAAFNVVTFDAAGIHAGNATGTQLIAAAGVYDNHR
jgi:hypothetical protein